jgi:hypothetical protein
VRRAERAKPEPGHFHFRFAGLLSPFTVAFELTTARAPKMKRCTYTSAAFEIKDGIAKKGRGYLILSLLDVEE